MTSPGTAVVGLSGGVDSAVAALLLQRAGYRVVGATLRLHACTDPLASHGRSCCGIETTALAAEVAAQLGIRHYVLDVADEFASEVLAPSWAEYRRGRTPNPCVGCNAAVKFPRLLRLAADLGAEVVATGHYARIATGHGGPALHRGTDPAKDQSYFLFALSPAQLSRIRFPLGGWRKTEVRRLAEQAGLVNARQPESQDVCFVSAGGSFPEYLCQRVGAAMAAGDVVGDDGARLGAHRGIHLYTLGQRRGLGLSGGPFWVRALDAGANRVELTRRRARLLAGGCCARCLHWLVEPLCLPPEGCLVQTRYRQTPVRAAVRLAAPDGSALEVRFRSPVCAVTPGQALVLYDGDRVLGGGWIDAALAAPPETLAKETER